MASLRDELKKLGTSSLVYLVPTFLARGLAFLLSPVYAAILGPAEFGIVGFSAGITPLITTLVGFGVPNTTIRLHQDFPDEEERRDFYGTVLVFLTFIPLALGISADVLAWKLGSPFATLPFQPYGRIVLWTGILGILPSAFVNVFVAREEPRTVTTYNVASLAVTVGTTVLAVVAFRAGALGALAASLVAAVFNSVYSFVLLRRVVRWGFTWSKLKGALLFGAPMVPHQLSNWAMGASDRAILERFVAQADLGRYTLGYTFGAITGFVGIAISLAMGPILNRRLKARADDPAVPAIGSIAVLVTTAIGLEVALLAGPAVVLLTRADYRGSELVVPWVSAGFVFQGLYQVVSLGTLFSKKTTAFPVVSAVVAVVNVGLNILLVPRYGIIAAAVTTFLAYVMLAGAHAWLAHKIFPIAWEYGRLARIGAAALVTYFLVTRLSAGSWAMVAGRAAASAIFPVLLVVFGAVRRAELRRMNELVAAFLAKRTGGGKRA